MSGPPCSNDQPRTKERIPVDRQIIPHASDGVEALSAALDVAENAAQAARIAALEAELAVAHARAQLHDHLRASTKRQTRLLTAAEAAERLPGKALRPDGTPRDSVYSLLRRIGGRKHEGKWFVAEDVLERYVREGVT
jgi:hypothetical protein